jgi:DNA polymerase-3 subunit beta
VKFIVRAGELAEALALAGRVIPKTPSLAVYAGVRLTVKAGSLAVAGSAEGDTTVTVTVPVADSADGDAVLLPKPITTFLSTLRASTEVTVTGGDAPQIIVAAAGGSPYTFRVLEATFPAAPTSKHDVRSADFTLLSAAVAAVKDCAKKNKIVQLVSEETGLRLHATDGIRLTRALLPAAGFGPFSGLLPLAVVEQIADADITEVAVDRRGRMFTATRPKVSIVTRLVEEMFPIVDSVLAATPEFFTDVPLQQLRDALARLASVAEDKRPLIVALAGDELILSMSSVNLGAGAERIELSGPVTGEVTFGVNLEFLVAAAAAHSGAAVTLGWTHATQPLFMRSAEPLEITNVVMPVKLT